MYVLGLNGSPRRAGNTDILLDKALEGAQAKGAKTEKIILNLLKFSPCQECQNMREDGVCLVEDDFQIVYQKIKDADAIILASPIFFGSLSAQTKMMIDRFQCVWRAKYLFKRELFHPNRPGAFMAAAASQRQDFFENARAIVRNFFATTNVDYKEELFCPGLDKKGAILKHPELLKKGFELGRRIASEDD